MGCTLIQLLGQQRKFEALDISYHIEKLYEPIKGGSKNKMDDQMVYVLNKLTIFFYKNILCYFQYNKLMHRIRAMHKINNEIFGIVGKFYCTQSRPKEPIVNRFETPLEEVKHFDPPSEISLNDSSISIKSTLNLSQNQEDAEVNQKVETQV